MTTKRFTKANGPRKKLGRTVRRFNTGHHGSDITNCSPVPMLNVPASTANAARRRDERRTPPDEFYTFVVQNFDGRWSFVSVGHHRLVIYDQPRQMFRKVSEPLRDLWRRAVIDGAVATDEMVDITTLRLVKISMAMTEASNLLFHGDSEEEEYRRMAAVAKLSDREARLLRLVREKAVLKLHQAPVDSTLTGRVLDKANDCAEDFLPGTLVARL